MIVVEDLTAGAGDFRLTGVSLHVPSGAYAVLMGATGCGKTTLLETLCGLRPALGGTIRLDGRDITHWPPARRGIGFVPQQAALFPRMSVRDNLAFALRMRGDPRGARDARCEELATMLGIHHLLGRNAKGLSGGEAQRVALGRALAARPEVLILDEPLSALDEATHAQMIALIRQVRTQTRVTVLHVTHSNREAGLLADVLLRIEGGRLITKRDAASTATHAQPATQPSTESATQPSTHPSTHPSTGPSAEPAVVRRPRAPSPQS